LEAKFSLPGVCALTLLGYDLTVPSAFSDEYVSGSAFTDLIRRIELVGDAAFSHGDGELRVETRSGVLRQPFPHTRDSGTVESRVELVNQKFESLATPVIGDNARRLGELVADLEALPVLDELCALTRVP
jgi:2-methylcitrate dehydratase PrpD